MKSPSRELIVRFQAFGPDSLQLIEGDENKGQLDLDAANDALQGKFDECFRQFVLLNWDPYPDCDAKETYPEDVNVYSYHGYCQLAEILEDQLERSGAGGEERRPRGNP